MQKCQVKDYIINHIADLLMVDPSEIEDNVSITEDLGVDSLDTQELFLAISSEYDIPFSLTKIVNDAAVTLSYNQKMSNEEKLNHIEKIMMIKLDDSSRKNFLKIMNKEPVTLLIKKFQSYLTVDMLADYIVELKGGSD